MSSARDNGTDLTGAPRTVGRWGKIIWIGLLGALLLLASLLQLAPGLFLERAVGEGGDEFLLLQMTHHGDAAIYYLPRAREILDGRFPVSDLYVAALRGFYFVWPPGPQLLFAAFLATFPNPSQAYLATVFIFTLILGFGFALAGFVFLGSRLGAFVFAAVGVFTPVALHLPRAFFSPQLFSDIVVKHFLPVVRTPIAESFLARIEDPLLTLWLYLIALALGYRFVGAPSRLRGVLLGVVVGFLLYFYLYYWLFMVLTLGILFLLRLPTYNREEVGAWIVVVGTVLLFSVPYLSNLLALRALPGYGDYLLRLGLEYGRGFRWSVWREYLAYGVAAGFVFMILRRSQPTSASFFVASLATAVLVWNLQLVTGWNLPPDHWSKVVSPPLFILGAVLLKRAIEIGQKRFPTLLAPRVLVACAMATVFLLGAKKAINATVFFPPSEQFRTSYTFPKLITASWRWLDENAPPGSIVLSNSFLTSVYLTGYTALDPYLPHGQNTLAPTREVEDRFLTVHKLFGTPPDRLRFLLTYRRNLAAFCPGCTAHTALNLAKAPTYLYGHTYNPAARQFDSLRHQSDFTIPPEKLDDLLRRYRQIQPRWDEFRGSFVYFGPWEQELTPGVLPADPALELVYAEGAVTIYRVRSAAAGAP